MCGAVLQQERANGKGVWERKLETVQQHICVDEFSTAWLSGQSLQQEGLQCVAGAGQQQGAQAMEVGLRQKDTVVLGRVSFRLCEDEQSCMTIDTQLGLCALTTRRDKAPVGEE